MTKDLQSSALLSGTQTRTESVSVSHAAKESAVARLVAPLDEIAVNSPSLLVNRGAVFESAGKVYELPRYLFIGPRGGDAPLRLGIFAAIRGNEPEGARAIVQFLRVLEAKAELARGYCLLVYPVCNPTGFEDGTKHSRGGKDLNREFWTNSTEPEVRFLETELRWRAFDGIISLRTDATSDGFYGIAGGTTLTRHLIEPALKAAEEFLPRDSRPLIDGFEARDGIVLAQNSGALSAPPKARPRPFEIVLETPKSPPSFFKECAFVMALQSILTEYRKFIAYGANL
jgi:hypothetical protein